MYKLWGYYLLEDSLCDKCKKLSLKRYDVECLITVIKTIYPKDVLADFLDCIDRGALSRSSIGVKALYSLCKELERLVPLMKERDPLMFIDGDILLHLSLYMKRARECENARKNLALHRIQSILKKTET